jgi:hypothetical protein
MELSRGRRDGALYRTQGWSSLEGAGMELSRGHRDGATFVGIDFAKIVAKPYLI